MRKHCNVSFVFVKSSFVSVAARVDKKKNQDKKENKRAMWPLCHRLDRQGWGVEEKKINNKKKTGQQCQTY
jgi:hypothetical protein